MILRRTFAGLPFLVPTLSRAEPAVSPLLKRIRIGTIAVQDMAETEALYTRWLGYEVRERGVVDLALATAWGAPATAGRPSLMMSSPGAPDVYVRAVQADRPAGYRALTTLGWNSIEIIVDDVAKLAQRLHGSPFVVLAPPTPLQRYPSIIAMQVKGPSQEVLYLTMESGDRAASLLPYPSAFVGRPFIAVLAGGDIDRMLDWYGAHFSMVREKVSRSPTRILQIAQGLGPDHLFPTGTMRLAQHGNLIEFDQYPSTAPDRPRAPGQLPPGVAMQSFALADLDAVKLTFLTPPAARSGCGYEGHRAATVVGPAGELLELIEE